MAAAPKKKIRVALLLAILAAATTFFIFPQGLRKTYPAKDCMKDFPIGTPRSEIETQYVSVCKAEIKKEASDKAGTTVKYTAILAGCSSGDATARFDGSNNLAEKMDRGGITFKSNGCPLYKD